MNYYGGVFMHMNDLLIVAFLSALIAGVFLYKKYTAAVLHEKLNHTKRGQLKTIELLQDRGYTIIDCNRRIQLSSLIDGKSYIDYLDVDFLVKKGRVKYLVKVVSSGQSSRVGYRENRETLLGLAAVFGCPNLLLIDPERRQIRVLKSIIRKPVIQKLSRLLLLGSIFLLGAISSLVLWQVFFAQGGFRK